MHHAAGQHVGHLRIGYVLQGTYGQVPLGLHDGLDQRDAVRPLVLIHVFGEDPRIDFDDGALDHHLLHPRRETLVPVSLGVVGVVLP